MTMLTFDDLEFRHIDGEGKAVLRFDNDYGARVIMSNDRDDSYANRYAVVKTYRDVKIGMWRYWVDKDTVTKFMKEYQWCPRDEGDDWDE